MLTRSWLRMISVCWGQYQEILRWFESIYIIYLFSLFFGKSFSLVSIFLTDSFSASSTQYENLQQRINHPLLRYHIHFNNRIISVSAFVKNDTCIIPGSLHVKAKLPHNVGQHNTTLSYKLSVVDSCNNTVNNDIIIITYNVVSFSI